MNVNAVVRVNGLRYMRESAVMVTVNTAQTIDFLMIAANVGRT